MKGSRPLTDEEISSVLASFKGKYARRDRALFLLGVKSGFRISELLSLRVEDVMQSGRMVDRVTVQRKHMKKKTEGRTIILHPEAKKALADWLSSAHFEAQSYLFKSQVGTNKPINRRHALRILNTVYDANQLTGKLGTHCMRKSFANKVYDKLDHDLVKTQKALGHRNINSTVSYLSFREEDIDDAILKI